MRRRLTYRPSREASPPAPVDHEPFCLNCDVVADHLKSTGYPRMAAFVRRIGVDFHAMHQQLTEVLAKQTPPIQQPQWPRRTGD